VNFARNNEDGDKFVQFSSSHCGRHSDTCSWQLRKALWDVAVWWSCKNNVCTDTGQKYHLLVQLLMTFSAHYGILLLTLNCFNLLAKKLNQWFRSIYHMGGWLGLYLSYQQQSWIWAWIIPN